MLPVHAEALTVSRGWFKARDRMCRSFGAALLLGSEGLSRDSPVLQQSPGPAVPKVHRTLSLSGLGLKDSVGNCVLSGFLPAGAPALLADLMVRSKNGKATAVTAETETSSSDSAL
ncbi:hypothetical protein NDU88_010667 [Pleurodeles waltl]|uniref:Uncharacterized protein n=1 Tax=Pleurodeles waltl TaxID=8319 RepID=A0AAV7QWC4_PLEWA|nr:hypothetical protein NDU88_010667 [Pleurodeles waltl]